MNLSRGVGFYRIGSLLDLGFAWSIMIIFGRWSWCVRRVVIISVGDWTWNFIIIG